MRRPDRRGFPEERFADRREAGRRLAAYLADHDIEMDVVLALPRGGVPVGAEVAAAAGVPLDVFVVRKLGVPGHPELGMGAVAERDIRVVNRELVTQLGITDPQIDAVADRELAELDRRLRVYREGRPMIDVTGARVVVVDDGVATGVSARAAIESLRHLHPASIVLAVPVAASEAVRELSEVADRCVAELVPSRFNAVGQWYQDFRQVTDAEVAATLRGRDPG